uniref:Kanadaptin n=1 Tax=Phallusia mammillata TaxID=59560 RepID=A0A6F9DTF2_9ASCI|nr:kanadaptin [Phallusia mammillata]
MSSEASAPAPPVFKVPVIAGKTVKTQKTDAGTSEASTSKSPTSDGSSKPNPVQSTEERRPPVSFRTKSMLLPSEVYKPHRPTATEFLERHLKNKSKIKKAEELSKAAEQVPAKAESPEAKHTDAEEDKEQKTETSEISKVSKEVKTKVASSSEDKPKPPPPKLEYTKPTWSISSTTVDEPYSLEVLRAGAIIDKIELTDHEFFVFGRLPECNITLEHPSISRHHAILQFGAPKSQDENVEFQKDGSAGFYLFELGSTHGTFLNKAKVPQGKYYRLKVGHMIKFGNSTRTYILQGPSEDQEMESEESATELRDKAREERSKKRDLEKMMMGEDSDEDEDEKESQGSNRKVASETGISWGMLEDAVEENIEEEEKKIEKPSLDAIALPEKDPFYVKDPHKALKNFYEKEGMELDFECTERRPGQWNVRLELPVDTPTGKPIFAEASVTGKRKEAMVHCALEACRIMDRHGLFKRTERHRRKVKQWEKDDYYDSDEDQFLDRTGDLEQKRKQRKLRTKGKKALLQEKAQTYESLTEQIKELEKEVSEIEQQLNKDKEAIRTKGNVEDPLEEFMQQVKSGNTLDSITRSKLKHRLIEARKESARLSKLAEIARPISLPPVNQNVTKSLGFIGKMRGKKRGFTLPPKPVEQSYPVKHVTDDVMVVEEDDEPTTHPVPPSKQDETKTASTVTEDGGSETIVTSQQSKPTVETTDTLTTNIDEESAPEKSLQDSPPLEAPDIRAEASSVETIQESTKSKRTFGPTLPETLRATLTGEQPQEKRDENEEKEEEEQGEQSRKRRKRNRKPREKPAKQSAPATISNDPDYCDWIPPAGQSGDGTTSLNAKYGY